MWQQPLDLSLQKIESQTPKPETPLDLSLVEGENIQPFTCGSLNLPHVNMVVGSPPLVPVPATHSAGSVAFHWESTSPLMNKISTTTNMNKNGKAIRPFKAFRKGFKDEYDAKYEIYRSNFILQMKANEVARSSSSKMKKKANQHNEQHQIQQPSSSITATDGKTEAYWERRRKNNEAAKRSRDFRRQKEDEIAIRAAFLEEECSNLKQENALLKQDLSIFLNKFYRCNNSNNNNTSSFTPRSPNPSGGLGIPYECLAATICSFSPP